MLPLADWRAARLAALTAPDGWLNLVARIELAPGRYQVGTAQEVQLPSGPDLLGTLDLAPDGATFSRPGKAAQPFLPVPDAFPQLRIDPFLLEIHTVDGTPALRVRDLTMHPSITVRTYPDNPDFIIRAKWESFTPQATEIAMKGGTAASVSVTNRATFEHRGKSVTLT
ncbi:MAG: DUF1684 domain-containing protein, partial [Acetobacteraceae bacterium]